MSTFVLLDQDVFNPEALSAIQLISNDIINLQKTALQFEIQLNQLLMQPELPEDNLQLQQRVRAACGYHIPALEKLKNNIDHCPAKTENKLAGLYYNKLVFELHTSVCFHLHIMTGCKISFKVVNYLEHKRNYVIQPFHSNAYTAEANQNKTNSSYQNLKKRLKKKK